jgi:hypothetical protein
MKDTTSRTHMGEPNIHSESGVGEGTEEGGRREAKMLGHIRPRRTCAGCSSRFLSLTLSLSLPLCQST